MKNKTALLVILFVFVLLIGGAYILYNELGQNVDAQHMIVHATQQPTAEPVSNEVPSAGDAVPTDEPTSTDEPASTDEPTAEPEVFFAPDFHVYDRDGNTVHLSDFFGKPIVLNFWASWCGPCQSEMPDFNEKYAELGDEINFVMVNITTGRETMETATAFIDQNGYDFPVFYDLTSEAAITYGAHSLPTSFFINAEGHLIAQAIGAIDSETLQIGIDMITD